MDIAVITFEEIIKFNGHDWDQAYEVLNYHLAKGNIKKEVLESGLVVYHNISRVQRDKLVHEIIFKPIQATKVVMRPRRNRISRDERDIGL